MGNKVVGIVLFENVEVLDFCGPFEVFSATRLTEEKRREEPSPFEIFLVAEKKRPCQSASHQSKNALPPEPLQSGSLGSHLDNKSGQACNVAKSA